MSFALSGIDIMVENLHNAHADQKRKIMNALNSVLAEMANYIKDSGPWGDRTSNLRNSIGYIPAFFGRPEDISASSRMVTGYDKIAKRERTNRQDTLSAPGEGDGDSITGILYAGMEYAIYVEYTPGKWVISGAFTQYHSRILSMIHERMEAQG